MSGEPDYIEITDLKAPVLTDLQREALANAPDVSLDEDSVLRLAREQTGLTDFGDDGFRERLRIWLQSADEDAELSRLSRASVFGMCVRYAATRLRVEDLVRRHPEILHLPIERPLVIAGLPRSGTTHLQNFLAADKQLRSLPYWEAIRPIPAVDETAAPGEEDPRRLKCVAEWARADALMPLSKAMHEMSPDHISEDIEFQCIDFGSYHLEWLARVPRWRDHYLQMDQLPIYRYLKKTLQVLNFLDGQNKRWLLKCPQHMEQLIPLTTVFPDATVVITHRDPVASIRSAATGGCYGARIRRTAVRPDEIIGYWIDRYQRLLGRCVRDRGVLDPDRTVHVFFDRFMADSMATVEEIYAKAGLPLDDNLRADMNAFLAENQRGKHGQVRHNLRRDFGMTPEEVRAPFQFYLDAFPVAIEVK